MPDNFVTFERDKFTGAVKASPITNTFGLSLGGGPLTTTDEAYQTVPWLYRAVQYRANSVARFPFGFYRGGERIEEKSQDAVLIAKWQKRVLMYAELSRLLYGAAYFLKESNRFGLNTTPRYIPYHYVMPETNITTGLTGFRVSYIGNVPLERMVYIWEPCTTSETDHGPAPAYVALMAAGMLGALDSMATQYFRAGAVPITAVKIPPTTPAEEREKLQNWFTRFASGIRNAFKFLPVNQGTEFETVGSTPKESEASELTQIQRDNVAVALGVPPSIIEGRSTDQSNASTEWMHYYSDTIVPATEMLAEVLNVQLFAPLGLEIRPEPDRLEIMQEAQLQQAQAIQALTGGGRVISRRTALEWLDIDPDEEAKRIEEEKEKAPEPVVTATPPPQFGQPQAAGSAAEPDDDDDEEAQMKRWLTASLGAWRAGSPATVGAPFDTELVSASSANMIKRIYAAHWPRHSDPAQTWQVQAVAELARYNRLAEGALTNG